MTVAPCWIPVIVFGALCLGVGVVMAIQPDRAIIALEKHRKDAGIMRWAVPKLTVRGYAIAGIGAAIFGGITMAWSLVNFFTGQCGAG